MAGYYPSKYLGEEIDAAVDIVNGGGLPVGPGSVTIQGAVIAAQEARNEARAAAQEAQNSAKYAEQVALNASQQVQDAMLQVNTIVDAAANSVINKTASIVAKAEAAAVKAEHVVNTFRPAELERQAAERNRQAEEQRRKVSEVERVQEWRVWTATQQKWEQSEKVRNKAAAEQAQAARAHAEAAALQKQEHEQMMFWAPYSPTVTYQRGNKVSYNGQSYLCTQACTGISPEQPDYWMLIAGKGEQGEQGPSGITAPTDGFFTMAIEDGKLVVIYPDDTQPPPFSIEDGQLVYTVA